MRVVVAMSGGVDSSVAACLLQEQGHEVIGLTLQVWQDDLEGGEGLSSRACCSEEAVGDARRVAETLGIPYYVLNFREIFRETVIEHFMQEYATGRTPNPCVQCNKVIKFEVLLAKAKALCADALATGHYARISYSEEEREYFLRKAVDAKKDQSYFLYHIRKEHLPAIVMPLGEKTKEETRLLAKKFGLHVYDKRESQEICFVPGDYRSFLTSRGVGGAPGDVLDTHGNVVGKHSGVFSFTVGQRKGIGVTGSKPLYVLRVDASRGVVVVGEQGDLYQTGCFVKDVNWLVNALPEKPFHARAKIRSYAQEEETEVSFLPSNGVFVRFASPQRAITPGQSVVFYSGDRVLGGGIIERATVE